MPSLVGIVCKMTENAMTETKDEMCKCGVVTWKTAVSEMENGLRKVCMEGRTSCFECH